MVSMPACTTSEADGGQALRLRLAAALDLHKQVRLAEAAQHYEAILRDDPDAYDALQLFGVLSMQTGKPQQAAELFARALTLRPLVASLHANFALAMKEIGRWDKAIVSYEKATSLQPDFAEALHGKGVVFAGLCRWEEALACFGQAIALKPDFAEAYCDRGNVHWQLNRDDACLRDYDQAIALRPDYAPAHFNRGVALRRLARFGEAVETFDALIRLAPAHVEAEVNRAETLRSQCQFEEAARSYRRAIALKPNIFEAHFGLGVALRSLGQHAEAVPRFRRAIELYGGHAEPFFMLGASLQALRRFDEAILALDKAVALDPSHLAAHHERGLALHRAKRAPEAIESFNRVIALAPDSADAHLSRALCRLTLGDYTGGCADYEWRSKTKAGAFRRALRGPAWSGAESLQSKTIFIHGEQGFGDLFQFGRYALLASAMAGQVILSVPQSLAPFFRQWEPRVVIIGDDDASPEFDLHCPLMSLPRAFGTTVANIPSLVPYLAVDAARIEAWRARLGDDGLKIGVCWRTGNEHVDVGRSFDPIHLSALAQVPGVRLISLQLRGGPAPRAVESFDTLKADAGIFTETAAAIMACDLVVTCDTAVAHLAGALGAPTWVALKFMAEWRWLMDRADSPWYPTARLFRQRTDGDWMPVFAEMKAALIESVRSHSL